jgi:hypothetical protein
LTTKESNQAMVFLGRLPFMTQEVNIPLLKYYGRYYQKSNGSVQHLEYSIAEGLNKITKKPNRKLLLSKETVIARYFDG